MPTACEISPLSHRSQIRALATSAAFAAGLMLSACNSDNLSVSTKATKPVPQKLLAEIDAKDMDKGSPILVRLFKQEAELEIWKQDRSGRYTLLKTYPICRWSGDLGPKIKEGDRQAPEGFYSITPAQMNPGSAYYLSFNMGYPNAFDKALGRTGSQLMVHGDCSSRGCYAMTDEQISEIYALGRESFFGGQNAFQVQAYPFRMTAQNMAKHRNNPNMPFWKMIKEGNDHFEATGLEPKVDVCEKRYVFNAAKTASATQDPSFSPAAACPAYQVPQEIAEAVQAKQRQDEMKTAELISRGTPVARPRAGIDGGMHPVFASKLPEGQVTTENDGTVYSVASYLPAPGTIPAHVNPPKAPDILPQSAATSEPMAVSVSPRLATANANASEESFFNKLSRSVGLSDPDPQPAPIAGSVPVPLPKPVSTLQKPKASDKPAVQTKTAEPQGAAARAIPIERSQQTQTKPAFPDPPAIQPQQQPSQAIAGSQPSLQANTFDSRWSNIR